MTLILKRKFRFPQFLEIDITFSFNVLLSLKNWASKLVQDLSHNAHLSRKLSLVEHVFIPLLISPYTLFYGEKGCEKHWMVG